MKEWGVEILPDAEADIEGIYTHIANVLLEPVIAGKLVTRIKTAISKLDNMPERYRLYDKEPWRSKGLRLFPVGNYTVFYHVVHDIGKVFVDAVIYSGRDIDKIIENLEI